MCVIHPIQAWPSRTDSPQGTSRLDRKPQPIRRKPIRQRCDSAATDTPTSYPETVGVSQGVKQRSCQLAFRTCPRGPARHSKFFYVALGGRTYCLRLQSVTSIYLSINSISEP